MGTAPADHAKDTADERAKGSRDMRSGQTPEQRSRGSKVMNFFKQNPNMRKVANFGKKPWIEGASRGLIAAGFVTASLGYIADGDDGATAVTKAGVETGISAAGGLGLAAIGAWCGALAVLCVPAGGIGGGVLGGWGGAKLNARLDEKGFRGWKPYDATDKWFDWD